MEIHNGSDQTIAMEHMTNGNGDISYAEVNLDSEEPQHKTKVLANLNRLRKENQLCDAILVIGRHEIPIHRAVVAASSSHLLELFKKKQEKKEGQTQNMLKLKDVDFESFQYLLDYIYTGRLTVPGPDVKGVYKAAVKLKIADAARTCSQFLADNLSVSNCLGVCRFAVDDDLRQKTYQFIQKHIDKVTCSKYFFGLPKVQVEIIGAAEDLIDPSNNRHMIALVLSWAKDNLDEEKPRLDDLTEQVNILYLNKDNTLTDFKDINDERTKDEEIAIDYKCKKRQVVPQQKEPLSQTTLMGNFRKFSINPENPVAPKEWSVIADYQTKDRTFMSICFMNNDLVVLSVHCRNKTQSPTDSENEGSDSPVTVSGSFDRSASLTPLAAMSVSRCGFGLDVVDGKLFACGGYDRGECLKSTEMYDPKLNKWLPAADMCVPRGRFSTEIVGNVVYAVGGSNGIEEQKSVECYDYEKNKWRIISQVEKAKVSQALVCVDGKLYCIGGCVGQNGVPDCQVFDPASKSWAKIAPLTKGRYQIAVCYHKGHIYAIGGTDGWNCCGITERYNIEKDKWKQGPSLNVARRGAGCDILNGKIYVVGGSDGSNSLKSVEVLDNNNFVLGPPMSIGRANVGVVSYSDRLYAVGGFSGKKFLDTFEYLDAQSEEWCSYMPVEEWDNVKVENGESGSSVQELDDSNKENRENGNGENASS